jgi:hypothetical protein
MSWLIIYFAGAIATGAGSWICDRPLAACQRLSASCHLLLALSWPLYVAFLAAVAILSAHERRS